MNEHDPLSPEELRAWRAQEPADGFAQRVLRRIPADAPKARRPERWRTPAAAAASLSLAAAAFFALRDIGDTTGSLAANARTEVRLGTRGVAVLEPGAEISWKKGHVEQKNGKVLYRVEPGADFVVSSPEAEVHVLGTVFAVSIAGAASEEPRAMNKGSIVSGISGAALAALATVAVYEGKVRVKHEGHELELGAGERAETVHGGVRMAENDDDSTQAAATLSAARSDTATAAQVAAAVATYKEQLEALETQRRTLGEALKASEEKLAAAEGGKPARTRPEFDLDANDWRELAKSGTVKYRMPCVTPGGWRPSPEHLNKLGLAPSDADVIQEAYKRTQDSVWAKLKPLCMASVGVAADVAERIGVDGCTHLVTDIEGSKLKDEDRTANMQKVGEIMAGDRPEPAAKEKPNPALVTFLTVARANKTLEEELSKSYGPEEAHRLAFDPAMCGGSSSFRSGRPPKK